MPRRRERAETTSPLLKNNPPLHDLIRLGFREAKKKTEIPTHSRHTRLFSFCTGWEISSTNYDGRVSITPVRCGAAHSHSHRWKRVTIHAAFPEVCFVCRGVLMERAARGGGGWRERVEFSLSLSLSSLFSVDLYSWRERERVWAGERERERAIDLKRLGVKPGAGVKGRSGLY